MRGLGGLSVLGLLVLHTNFSYHFDVDFGDVLGLLALGLCPGLANSSSVFLSFLLLLFC